MQRFVDHSFARLTSFPIHHHRIQWKSQHSLLNITFVRALPLGSFVATSSIFLLTEQVGADSVSSGANTEEQKANIKSDTGQVGESINRKVTSGEPTTSVIFK